MKQTLLEEVTSKLSSICDKYRIQRAIVFGSIARGDQTRHSDLDLILVQETDKRFLERYEGILKEIVAATPGRDVHVLIYTPQELQELEARPFVATALREGKTIYESE